MPSEWAGGMAEPRLFVEGDLAEAAEILAASPQAHYLQRVMRLGPGAAVRLFNGRDGEWRATLSVRGRDLVLRTVERVRQQAVEPGPILGFAPIRRQRQEWLVEKAVELGASALLPVRTRRAEAGLGPIRRLEAIMVEAAEQCGRLDVPPLLAETDLPSLLAEGAQSILALDPTASTGLLDALDRASPPLLLIGPEGGFESAELAAIAATDRVTRARLGPSILRAETAAIAALAVWRAASARREP